jgi:hypothetical protein
MGHVRLESVMRTKADVRHPPQVYGFTPLVAELDAGIPDDFCPFGRFFPDDRGKLGRRVADDFEAESIELLAHLRHRQDLDGLIVQFIQNVLWPDSAMVGSSGASAERLIELTASARNFPSRTSGIAFTILANAMVIRLASRSGSNSVVPR